MRTWLPALILFGAACHGGQGPKTEPLPAKGPNEPTGISPAPGLVGVQWTLRTLRGQTAAVGNRGKQLTLRFAPDGNAGGFSGCNSYKAKYTNHAAQLRLKSVTATETSCARGMTEERAYLAALAKVDGWRIAGGQLELLASGSPIAVFEPQ